ncbi:MAG: hypothetical protein AB7T06_03605 [Kofleriaceae bacterium]
MKTHFASILLLLIACGGSSKSSATTQPAGDTEPDPTVPSWLPPSCIAYHKAVVQAIDCQAVEQDTRDRIRTTFDETSVGWKTEDNANEARIDEIAATCSTATDSVRADIADKCI